MLFEVHNRYVLRTFGMLCEWNCTLTNGTFSSHQVLNSADKDGVWLEQVKMSTVEMRQHLHVLTTDSEPSATTDDFYGVLGILLSNLSCRRGSDVNRGWFQNRVNDLVMLFPDISEELTVPLYDEAQADAICAFGEQWPHTRAAICSIILKGHFKVRAFSLSSAMQ